jgi:ATP-dependent protease ClpP protease subunit
MKFAYRTEANAKAVAAYWNVPLEKHECFKVESQSEDSAELIVAGYIGWPFNDAGDFVKTLAGITAKTITVRINSQGGDIFDGFQIYEALRHHKAKIITRIESLAASAASIIALGGETQAYKSAFFMIHNAKVGLFGDPDELREAADIVDKIINNMIDAYADNSNIGKRELRDMMKAETWLSAKEAKEKGFINTILDGKPVKAQFDLSIFANVPDDIEGVHEPAIFTGFDVEKALRDAKAPKAFAKAVAAACRAAKLVDGRQADDELSDEEAKRIEAEKREIEALTAEAKRILSVMRSN